MNQYVVIQRCYRDDNHDNDAKEYSISFFHTMEFAVEHIIKCIKDLRWQWEHHPEDYPELSISGNVSILRKYLADGSIIWEWEWERRGNHDAFRIIKIDTSDKICVNFYDDVFDSESKTIEQILGFGDDDYQ